MVGVVPVVRSATAAAGAAALALALLLLPPAPKARAASHSTAATSASRWLAARLGDDGTLRNPLGGALPDHGLMIDVLFALHASGDGKAAEPIATFLDGGKHASDYFTWDGLVPDKGYDAIIVGGATAKTLVAAEVAGRDPKNFGGYDMVAETKGAIRRSGPDKGRVSDYSKKPEFADMVSNNANMFGQALAVIGLAGAGANDRIAIDKLASQQCSEGYFRIFFGYIPTDETGDHVTENGQKVSTCDEGKAHGQSAPDGDATGLALSALLAARKAGATGLDGPIDRTVDWLKGHQKPGGGWGGGVSTEAPNTNSTGLIVQSLAEAGGATAAVDKGAAYLASAQATKERDAGNALSAQIGAIGYTPGDYEAARTGGITGIDTWIRAGAQASLGLAQTGFFDLVRGKTPPEGEDPPTDGSGGDPDDPDDHAGPDDSDDPSDTKDPKGRAPNKKRPGSTGSPSHHRTPPNSDRDPDTGRPAPPPDSPRGAARTVVQPRDKRAEPAPDTPAGRLGRYLANRLTDGDHIEITQDGKKYVDYDATADLVLALRVLDEQPKAVAGATGFLLASDSVQAYAYGAPYESGPAAYAEPLAKLRLLAGFRTAARTAARPTAADSTPQAATASRLTADLAALRTPDGRFTDKGEHGEATGSTRRHAWATIATLADPSPAAAPAAKAALRTLIKQQCKDGTFPKTLRPEADGCRTGDLAATAAATEALNAQPAAGTSAAASDPRPAEAASAVPKGWAPGRFRALSASAAALNRNADADGLIRSTGTTPDTVLSALTAAGRQAAGLDATTTARALGPLLRPDGGMAEPRGTRSDPVTSIAVAPGVAGGSWISAPGSPVSRAVTLTADALDRDPATASGNRDGGLPTWAVATLAAAGCVLVLAAFPAVRRFVRKNVRRSGGTKAVTT